MKGDSGPDQSGKGAYAMGQIYSILSSKLSSQGLLPAEISRLIRDVSNITGSEAMRTVSTVNRKLEVLGWEAQTLDESTYELILFLSENTES